MSLKSLSRKPNQLVQFNSSLDSSTHDISCLVLVKFKLALLELFAHVGDEVKSKLMESIHNLLVSNLSESNSLAGDEPGLELRLNKAIVELIVDSYLLNSNSYEFFNKNEKHFDYLIGYLNNNSQVCIRSILPE